MARREYSFEDAVDEVIVKLRQKRGSKETKQEKLLVAFRDTPGNTPSREEVSKIFEGGETDPWRLAQKKMSEVNAKLKSMGYKIGEPKTLGVVKIEHK